MSERWVPVSRAPERHSIATRSSARRIAQRLSVAQPGRTQILLSLPASEIKHKVGNAVGADQSESVVPVRTMRLLRWQSGDSLAHPPYQNRIKTSSVRPVWVVRRAKSRFPKLLKGQR